MKEFLSRVYAYLKAHRKDLATVAPTRVESGLSRRTVAPTSGSPCESATVPRITHASDGTANKRERETAANRRCKLVIGL